MKIIHMFATGLLFCAPAFAEESRELDAHEHGVGQLDIAFDGDKIAIELHAPGADIVGFEYEAQSAEDKEAVEKAIALLAKPLDLFIFSDAAGCNVLSAASELESEEDHDDHKGHDDHDDHGHDEHDKDEHADHEDHAEEAGHTEFHAEYTLSCTDISALNDITFAYFDQFPNALELEVQMISDKGATAFEVERDQPKLDLRGMF